jgi:hypothetical protein
LCGGILAVPMIFRRRQPPGAEQTEHWSGGDRGHVAALLIQPPRIALLGDAVADEGRPRRAQGDQLVRVDGQVTGSPAAQTRLRRAVLQEVAGHPVVLPRSGQALDCLAEVAPEQRRAALAGGADKDDCKARLERHRDQGRLAKARYALDAHACGVDRRVGFEEVEGARSTPGPRAQGAPVVGLAWLASVHQADDAARQPGAIVGLHAHRVQEGVTPPGGDQLLGRRRIVTGRWRRHPRIRRRGWFAGRLWQVPLPEHDDHRDGALRLGSDQDEVDVDGEGRRRRVVDVTNELAPDDRCRADEPIHLLRDRPRDVGCVRGNPPVDLPLEILDELGTAGMPPRTGRRDALAVLQRQRIRQLREGVRQRLVGVRVIGGVLVSAGAGSQPGNPELIEHVLVVLLRRPGRSVNRRAAARRRSRRGLGLLRPRGHRREQPDEGRGENCEPARDHA